MSRNAVNRITLAAAFALGLLSIVWVGAGFIGTSAIALAMTFAIGAAYLMGALEVRRFRSTTASLAISLAEDSRPLSSLNDWLGRVPASLQDTVRQRVEGERVALPGLALTPYLIGLLVMLGMLGTFLGMVVTFKGAVFALEGSADLQAIRSALAAPIKGLGLAFGTSVAGVATSAMLGLMSAISRRERVDVVRQLDTRIATDLRPYSLAHQRQETLKALQQQAGALPDVVVQLKAMMEQVERRSQQLDEQLLDRQERFHREAAAAYTGLGQSVALSLKDSLTASARVAGETIRPVVESAMAAIASESQRLHGQVSEAVQTQLQGLSTEFSATTGIVADAWTSALTTHTQTSEQLVHGLGQALAAFTSGFEQRASALLTSVNEAMTASQAEQAQTVQQQVTRTSEEIARLLGASEALVHARTESEARWTQEHGERMDQLAALWRSELAGLRGEEESRGQAAVARLGDLQSAMSSHLATLGAALEAPITRLLATASEAPKAAAEVIAQLRQEMSQLTERDNVALQERAVLVENIGTLLHSVQQTTGEQRAAIEALVNSATGVLNQASQRFSETLGAQASRTEDVATKVAGSAAELASLGGAFNQGVQLFSAANEKLVDNLQRIEGAIQQSMARSDEQLAYYVAQAREVIDLSISSQQSIVEDLHRLRSGPSAAQRTGSAA